MKPLCINLTPFCLCLINAFVIFFRYHQHYSDMIFYADQLNMTFSRFFSQRSYYLQGYKKTFRIFLSYIDYLV